MNHVTTQVLVSAISRRPCYVFATATMEAKAGGTKPRVRWADRILTPTLTPTPTPTPTLTLIPTLTLTRYGAAFRPEA